MKKCIGLLIALALATGMTAWASAEDCGIGTAVYAGVETKEVEIEYQVTKVDDPDRYAEDGAEEVVIQAGVKGLKEVSSFVSYENGAEKERKSLGEKEISSPEDEIISVPAGQYTVTYETETVEIPYESETRYDSTEYKGTEYVAKSGQNGTKEIKYEIKTDNSGKQVSKTVVSETITKQPRKEIYIVGTFEKQITYEVIHVDDVSWMKGTRNAILDQRCEDQALYIAENGVQHSSPDGSGNYGESVGGWATLESAIAGTEQHGGPAVNDCEYYGFAVVKKTETQPDGTVRETYYAVSQGDNTPED